jgi:hypothetical protein
MKRIDNLWIHSKSLSQLKICLLNKQSTLSDAQRQLDLSGSRYVPQRARDQ